MSGSRRTPCHRAANQGARWPLGEQRRVTLDSARLGPALPHTSPPLKRKPSYFKKKTEPSPPSPPLPLAPPGHSDPPPHLFTDAPAPLHTFLQSTIIMATFFTCTFFCLPPKDPAQHLPEGHNAFDLTWKDYVPFASPAACCACLPSARNQGSALLAAGVQPRGIDDYLDEDQLEFEALLNGADGGADEQYPGILTGNPFGKKHRRHKRKAIMPPPDIEGDEPPFEIFLEEHDEEDAEFLPDERIHRFAQGLAIQTPPTFDDLAAEERAAELEEEAEIQRKRRAAKQIAKDKGLLRDESDNDPYGREGYNQYDGEFEQELQDHPTHTPIIVELPPEDSDVPEPTRYRYDPPKAMSVTLPVPTPTSRASTPRPSHSSRSAHSRSITPRPAEHADVAVPNSTVPYALLNPASAEAVEPRAPKPSRNPSTTTDTESVASPTTVVPAITSPTARTHLPPTPNVLLTEKLEDLTEKLAYIKKNMMRLNFENDADEDSEDGREQTTESGKVKEGKKTAHGSGAGRPRSVSASMWDWGSLGLGMGMGGGQKGSTSSNGASAVVGRSSANNEVEGTRPNSVDLDSIADLVLDEYESTLPASFVDTPPVSRRHSSSTPTATSRHHPISATRKRDSAMLARQSSIDVSRPLGQAFAQSSSDSPFFGDESPFAFFTGSSSSHQHAPGTPTLTVPPEFDRDAEDDDVFSDLGKVAKFLQTNVVGGGVRMFNRAVSVAKTQGQELQKSTAGLVAEATAVVTGESVFRREGGTEREGQQREGGRTRGGSAPTSPKGDPDWIISSTVGV